MVAAQAIEYVIAALAGLLAAQTFLVGLMAVRLDASYDSAVARIAKTARRIGRFQNEQMPVSDVLEEARDVVAAVREEVSVRGTLVAVGGVIALSGLVAMLGTGANGAAVPVGRLTYHWSDWQAGETSVLVLFCAVVGLGVLCVQRARKSRQRLQRALERHGLAAAAAANSAVETIASAEGDEYAVDRARLALRELDLAFPGWAGTAELRGDLWAAIATHTPAREVAGVTIDEALRRARADYASARELLPAPTVDVLLRDGDAVLSQAAQLAKGTRERWLLLMQAVERAEEALKIAHDSAPAALLLNDAVASALAEPRQRPWGNRRAADVTAVLRGKVEKALDRALARDAVDFDVLYAWTRNRVETAEAEAGPRNGRDKALADKLAAPAARLIGHLTDVAGRMRAAPSNTDVLQQVHEAVPVLLATQEVLQAIPAPADREAIAGVWLPFADDVVDEADLLPIARRGDLSRAEVVFARALLAYRRLAVDGDPVRAVSTLLRMPVRRPDGGRIRVRRAAAGTLEVVRVWLGA